MTTANRGQLDDVERDTIAQFVAVIYSQGWEYCSVGYDQSVGMSEEDHHQAPLSQMECALRCGNRYVIVMAISGVMHARLRLLELLHSAQPNSYPDGSDYEECVGTVGVITRASDTN
jgi:hypothetical protein